MKSKPVNDAADLLDDGGDPAAHEYGIGRESFRHLRNIQRQMRLLQRLVIVLAGFVVLLSAAIIATMLAGTQKPEYAADGIPSAVVDTVEKIKSENRLLKEKNHSLENDIKLMRKQFLSRKDASPPPYKAGTRENNPVAPDTVYYHEVKKGETLYSLAEKYYGDGQMYQKIMKANNLTRQSDIYEGKQLKIYSPVKKSSHGQH